ncbi:CDP-alcohol phosphatidyltransferase family protein [Brachybacterium sp. J144]|uniref:CDP-alcohol phosphatidyltransferase family protein n=1 Tax=unclassified Brachybacterium TaxID=2623841 RepID=UPI002E75F8E8|nr:MULTISPECIES: CDP-alcohol phosphatidyltransferase family protein [unclassified Brachybacterium]MEE1618772.1 CDP-alcohol phosphatidyltransferase family protein [Brachybacterium sp. J153]MEE1649265.1 CDP-alcohol phosphatidyltransferase family protein [Brachybacterium sp. J144]
MSSPRRDWATLPNLVTLLRFVLLLPVCRLLLDGPDTLAVVLLLVWASTDWVDGLLARTLDQTSRVGEIIDPIADRLGLAAIVLTLALAGLLPWAALVLILLMDVAMAALATRAALGGRIAVSRLGKVRTFVLMSSVFLLVAAAAWAPGLIGAVQVLVWIGVVLHVVSAADYILRARRPAPDAPAAAGPPSSR